MSAEESPGVACGCLSIYRKLGVDWEHDFFTLKDPSRASLPALVSAANGSLRFRFDNPG